LRQFEDFWTDKPAAASANLSCPCCSGKDFGTISAAAHLGFAPAQSVSVNLSAAPAAAAVPNEILVDGTIEPDEVDFYSVTLVEGQTYLFSLYGSGDSPLGDTYLYLFDESDVLVASDDDGGSGTNSLFTFTATYSGTYYVGAAAYPGSELSGGYTLDVITAPGEDVVPETFEDAAELTIGEVTYGFIDEGTGAYGPTKTEVDTYRFTAEAGTVVTIEVAGGADSWSDWSALPPGELDTLLAIYDANGNQVALNDDISFPRVQTQSAS